MASQNYRWGIEGAGRGNRSRLPQKLASVPTFCKVRSPKSIPCRVTERALDFNNKHAIFPRLDIKWSGTRFRFRFDWNRKRRPERALADWHNMCLRTVQNSIWACKLGAPVSGCDLNTQGRMRLGNNKGRILTGTAAGSVPMGSSWREPDDTSAA